MFTKIKEFIQRAIRYVTHDIWRVEKGNKSKRKLGLINVIKAFILAIRNVNGADLNTHAAALTYRTLLALVPMLAVLFAIARGFNLQGLLENQLYVYFDGQGDALKRVLSVVDQSLQYAESGLFLGIGIIVLLYTVVGLLAKIEDTFNGIWQINKPRNYYRMFTDYLALVIIAPVFLILNTGLSFFLNAVADEYVIGVVISPLIKLLPLVITILIFTFLFIYIPNTKVRFTGALIAGVFTGICFQVFQSLYINGQIWITKYNAIYGSFAALPLLLLWMQLTWFIILFGVELTFAYQNVNKFDFEHETRNITRRYLDFVYLTIMTLIVKRFEKGEEPYTADQLSEEYKIPTRLTSDILFRLHRVGLITETSGEKPLMPAYMPAMDINQITVTSFFETLDLYGSEDFVIDKSRRFKPEWETILRIRQVAREAESTALLKDL